MSNGLLIFIDEGIKFKKEETIEAVLKIDGVYNVSIDRNNVSNFILSCEYDYQEYSVIVDFCNDLETFYINRVSKAGLNFAFQLQQLITQPIKLIDSDYSFDIHLQDIKSFEDLEQKVINS